MLQDKNSRPHSQKSKWLTANFHFHTYLPIYTKKSKLSINQHNFLLKHYLILVFIINTSSILPPSFRNQHIHDPPPTMFDVPDALWRHVRMHLPLHSTRCQCVKQDMKFIHAGYTKFLNMFKTFVLTCQPYTNEKNTIRMDRNGLEWPGMTPRINLNGPFVIVREQILPDNHLHLQM